MKTNEDSELFENVQWAWLKNRQEQGSLILVDTTIDLLHAGERLAADDTATVQAWLASRLIAKPTSEQITEWNNTPDTLFSMMIVRPFVLIQPSETLETGTTQ